MQLTTARLILTPFQLEELDLFHRINSDPYVRQFLWDDQVIAIAIAEDILTENQKLFDQHQYGLWKIALQDGSIIGYTGLWFFFEEAQPQLIYALLPEYSQRGFATEAARRIITYAFDDLGFDYLMAATDEPHHASQKVAHRLGMDFIENRIEDDKPTLFYRIDNKLN